jgi:hypothetical protein
MERFIAQFRAESFEVLKMGFVDASQFYQQ